MGWVRWDDLPAICTCRPHYCCMPRVVYGVWPLLGRRQAGRQRHRLACATNSPLLLPCNLPARVRLWLATAPGRLQGGELLCCDGCNCAFHFSCVNLDAAPQVGGTGHAGALPCAFCFQWLPSAPNWAGIVLHTGLFHRGCIFFLSQAAACTAGPEWLQRAVLAWQRGHLPSLQHVAQQQVFAHPCLPRLSFSPLFPACPWLSRPSG